MDSEYEEMASSAALAAKWGNSNPGAGAGQGAGACSQCVTVINVCPSPGHTLQPAALQHQPRLQQRPAPAPGQQQQQEPPYENLSFHKVTINVPDTGGGDQDHHLYTEKPRVLLRKPPLRKSKVPLKYQGIKRVKSKSKTQKHEHGGGAAGLDKSGYSQKEVWNWLYLEEAAKNNGFNIEAYESYPDDGSDDAAREKSVSVQFSPVEFLQATNRLAHLNLEGFERFVGNTIDRALAGARAKSSDVLEQRDREKDAAMEAGQDSVDNVYVVQDTCPAPAPPPAATAVPPSCGHGKLRPVCEACVRSGDSSCSSALSSLESVKSSLSSDGAGAARSRDSSSARGSYLSAVSSIDPSDTRGPGGGAPDYMRMSGQKIYRSSKVRASLPVGGGQHKPYQTLEVSPDLGEYLSTADCTDCADCAPRKLLTVMCPLSMQTPRG